MSKTRINCWGHILGTCLAVAACGPPASEAIGDEDVLAIQMAHQAFVAAEIAGDWEGAASVFSTDAVRMEPYRPWIEGRAAIQAGLETADFAIDFFTLTSAQLFGVGRLAVDRGKYVFAFIDRDTGVIVRDEGKYLTVWEKENDGVWRITTNIYNSDLPID